MFFAHYVHLETATTAQLTVIMPLGSNTTTVSNIRKYPRRTRTELKHRRQQLKRKMIPLYTTDKENSIY